MSVRARRARRLASLLTTATGVPVEIRYERAHRAYRVVWTGGPGEVDMRALATPHAAAVPELDLAGLHWSRRQPS